MVVNRLYYNSGDVSSSVQFSPDILRRALLNIYSKKFHPVTDIEANLFNGIWDKLNLAVSEGYKLSVNNNPDDDFTSALRHSNAVFSTFKVHRAQNDMARLLLDSDGNLKSFERWSNDVLPIASHQVGTWLRTEYDTAVIRAHQAADWLQFERQKDILPNLEWIPSTSVTPGVDHSIFWGTIRPVDDPFWSHHRPGDRWNCKCALRSTDKPVTPVPQAAHPVDAPQSGLNVNPGTSRQIFSDDHPYFPKDCSVCPFYKKSLRNRLKSIFINRAKDCYNCPYINDCIDRIATKRHIDSAAFTVKQRVKDENLMPKLDKTPCQTVMSGILNRTNKVRNTLLKHCHHDYDVEAAIYIWNHPERLKFVRVSPLGEGKDPTSEKDIKNIRKKMFVLDFLEFRIYNFDYAGKTFVLKTAFCKKGYEQFYSLMEK